MYFKLRLVITIKQIFKSIVKTCLLRQVLIETKTQVHYIFSNFCLLIEYSDSEKKVKYYSNQLCWLLGRKAKRFFELKYKCSLHDKDFLN